VNICLRRLPWPLNCKSWYSPAGIGIAKSGLSGHDLRVIQH